MRHTKFLNIGYGNVVQVDRIICIVSPESAPIKRIIQEAKEKGTAVDATYGRKTRAVIVTDSQVIILTPIHVETISQRLNNSDFTDGDT